MSIENTVENLEKRTKQIIGVPCIAIVDKNRIEVTSCLLNDLICLQYKKNGQVVDRTTLLSKQGD